MQKTIFITGTDTGVGKTVLTALLLSHLRQTGSPALAIKPFCSGGRGDAELLQALQSDAILETINPFYFSEPLAPLVAARHENRQIPFAIAFRHVRAAISLHLKIENRKSKIKNSTLLIEGAGGLLSPLGEPNAFSRFKVQGSNHYTALDLIRALKCCVILVAPNRLGTINHTLLTIRALRFKSLRKIKVVLMDCEPWISSLNTQYRTRFLSPITHHESFSASQTNPRILAELLSPIRLFRIPYLAKNPSKSDQIHQFAKKCKKTLAQILA